MKISSTQLFVLASIYFLSFSASAYDAAHPDTAKKLNEAVERFYESKPASARPRPAELAFAPQPTCSKPRYPRAARLYKLEGNVVLSFQVDAAGRPKSANIDRSTRWAILDQAAIEALSACVFDPDPEEAWQKRAYSFSLDDE